MECVINKKKILFVYKSTEQTLKVYKGTTLDEIKQTLCQIFDLEMSKKLYLLDEDGDVVVLSSSIPDGTKLFVKIEDVNSIYPVNTNLSNWDWLIPNNEYIIINGKSFKTFDVQEFLIFGNVNFTKGVHYWTFTVSHLMCCHDFGVVKEMNRNNFQSSYFLNKPEVQIGLPDILEGELAQENYSDRKTGPAVTSMGSANLKNNTFGCYLDMDTKIFAIVNETKQVLYMRQNIGFNPAIPYYFSRKHPVDIELKIKDPPESVIKLIS